MARRVKISDLRDRTAVVSVDRACDDFEAAWRAGGSPRAEDYLPPDDDSLRAVLLAELIPIEVEYRRKRGDHPRPDEYAGRFPDLDSVAVRRLVGVAPAPPPTAPAAGERFRLLRKAGQGACGVVWQAHDTLLDRVVALKLPHPALVDSPDAVERFRREARAAARLHHPGIVAVHEVVAVGGTPAMVEDFVAGEPLRDLLARRRLPPFEAAELVAAAAEAVEYAHSVGSVHRDLKPANVMVEAGPDGKPRPRLVDFGLVADAAEATLTADGQVIGTPAYMSPEQAAGDTEQIDHRTDVYSLGVVLYECLTGEVPFRGTRAMLLDQIVRDDPRPPRRIDHRVPRDLDTVCRKAMAKEPRHRYQTAGEFAADLRRWLAGEPVKARPVGAAGRAVRWVRRRPTRAALLAVTGLLAVAVGAAGVSAAYYSELQQAFAETDQARAAEAEQRELAEAGLYSQRMVLASREWEAGNVGRAEQVLDECPPGRRGWEWDYLRRACHGELLSGTQPATRHGWWSVTSVAWSRDGKGLLTGGKDGGVYLWDAASCRPLRRLATHPGGVLAVAWSPDARLVAFAGLDSTVRVVDTFSGAAVHTLDGHVGHVYSLAFSPDGKTLASGGGRWLERRAVAPDNPGKPEVKLWEVSTGRELRSWPAGQWDVTGLAFRPGGKELATASGAYQMVGAQLVPGEAAVWDAETGAAVRTLRGHAGPLTGVAYSPDGRRLATAGGDQTVRVWDADTGAEVLVLRGHLDWTRGAAFSRDGGRIASAGADGTVRVWDAETGRGLFVLRGHSQPVLGVAYSPDGTRLATAGGDQTVKVWDPAADPGGPWYAGHGAGGPVAGLAFAPDGKTVYSAANPPGRAEVHAWRADTGVRVREYSCPAASVTGLALSRDGGLLAASGDDGRVHLWDAATGRPVPGPPSFPRTCLAAGFAGPGRLIVGFGLRKSPDGSPKDWALTGCEWDAAAGAGREDALDPGFPWVRCGAGHPREAAVATGDDRGWVRLWHPGRLPDSTGWPAHDRVVCAVAFSRDGSRLASGSWDGTVKVWDPAVAADGTRPAATLRGHARPVLGVAFSPDGKRLASGSEDRTVKVWDIAGGWEILSLTGHLCTVTAVAFSPDGSRVASAGADGRVKVWGVVGPSK